MSTPIDLFGVLAPTNSGVVACLYLPSGLILSAGTLVRGTTLTTGASGIYFSLYEAPSFEFNGSIDASGTAMPNTINRPYTIEARVVASGINYGNYTIIGNAFLNSNSIAFSRDRYAYGGGYLRSGEWQINSAAASISGPSSVTLNWVNSNGDPVSFVSFTISGIGSAISDNNGSLTVGLADGTYTVISQFSNGIVFSNYTLTVSGNTTATISGTGITLSTPPLSTQTVGYIYARDSQGTAMPRDIYHFVMSTLPSDATDAAEGFAGKMFSIAATNDSNAIVSGLFRKNAEYKYWRGSFSSQTANEFTAGSGTSFIIPAILE